MAAKKSRRSTLKSQTGRKKRVLVRPSTSTGKRKPTPRPHYNDNTRAAITSALLTGQGVAQIAKDLRIPESTIRNYRRDLTPDQIAQINEKRAGHLDDMLWSHLEGNFAAMAAITTHVQSQKYVQRHNPSDLAVLFGVINDKSVRILDAVERARSPQRRDDDSEGTEHTESD